MSYTSVFGGTTIYPSDVSYLSLALAANTPLEWPLESSGTLDPAARIIDVTPAAAGYSIDLPDATLTGAGQTILFNNLGVTHSFFVKDFAGNTLATVTPGTQWQVYLAAVTTAAGTWRVFQFGASTATVQPSALEGFGLTVTGATLSQSLPVVTLSTTGTTVSTANRACAFVWTATGAGTLNLLTAAAAGNNFFVFVRNEGGGDLVIEPAGTETINSDVNLTLRPGDSATIITDGTTWYTIGLGRQAVFAFDYTSIGVTGGNYTLAGAELNRIAYRFVGLLTSDVYIIVPPTVQQYWVNNDTTGAFSLFVRTSGGTPELVGPGAKGIYYCDGSDIILGSDPLSITTPVIISDGGTGATTASAARLNLGITLFADAIVTATTGASVRTTIGAAASGANNDITSLTGLTTAISVPQGGTGQTTYTNGQLLIGNTTGNTLDKATLTAGSGVSITNGAGEITINATGSGGTVTSVGGTGTVNGITLTGTVTTSGSLTLGGTLTDVDLTTQVIGTLPVGNGGTGATTLTSGYLVKGNGASAASASVVYDDGTNVGIGTSTPGAKLDVIGEINSGPITVRPSGSGGEGGQISLQDPTGAFPAYNFDVDGSGDGRLFTSLNNTNLLIGQLTGTGGFVTLNTASNERMRVTSAGFVGIGTSAPGYRLDVAADDTLAGLGYGMRLRSNATAGAATFQFTTSTASAQNGVITVTDAGLLNLQADGVASAVTLRTAGNERMRIDATGNVGIGNTPSGTYKLEVTGATYSSSMVLGAALPVASGGTGQISYTDGQLLIGNTTGNTLAKATLTAGSGVSITNGAGAITIAATGSGGTVTSVGGTGTVNGITLTGTVTSTGSLTLGGALSGVDLTSQVTGTLPVASGGSGQTSYTDGQLLIGNTVGNTLAKATLTAGSGISITNGNGSITITSLAGGGSVTSVSGAGTVNGLTLTGTVTTSGSLTLGGTLSGVSLTTQVTGTLPIANGGTGATTAAAARTALGATTLGANVFTITNPSAITFPRFNADNTVSALDAATFRTAIGAGAGTVTSVGGTGTVNGLTLTGTVTSSGSLTLGGTLSGVSLTTQVSGTLPVASGGTGQTTYTNGQLLIGNTTGNTLAKATLTAGTGIAITNGAGTITIAATGGSGTVTSVSGAGTVNGLTLTGTVTSSGSLTLGGTLSGVSLTTQVSGTLPIANGGTGATTAAAARTALGSTTVGDGVFTAVNAAAGRTALSAAASGANSDITALDQDVTITVTGTIAADTIGFRGIPQNAQTASYTLALSDAGRHISNTTGGFVIPANGTVPFPIGTTIVLFNNSASSQSVTITTDTLRLAGTATTGTRTLAQYGLATCVKVTSTVWVISGAGLT